MEEEGLSLKSISEDTSPVVKLVNSTLYDALRSEASDIHLETYASGMAIKYRVDGVLCTVGSVAGSETAEQAISRIKVMKQLAIRLGCKQPQPSRRLSRKRERGYRALL